MVEKKKVVFLFCGQARCNPFALNTTVQPKLEILLSYIDLIFTDDFKDKYDYTIYISSDDIHLDNTRRYFKHDKISNLHLMNVGFYQQIPEKVLPPESFFHANYNAHDVGKNDRYCKSISQQYKIADAYHMFRSSGDLECDYMVRMRMDIIMRKDFVTEILSLLEAESTKLQIVMQADIFAVGRKETMMDYFSTLENRYGTYTDTLTKESNTSYTFYKQFYGNRENVDISRWTYAPETQLFATLLEHCEIYQKNIDEILHLDYFCDIIR